VLPSDRGVLLQAGGDRSIEDTIEKEFNIEATAKLHVVGSDLLTYSAAFVGGSAPPLHLQICYIWREREVLLNTV
jgi:hypothetical protein